MGCTRPGFRARMTDHQSCSWPAQVKADKEREVRDGHDGTWVAHPALVPVARAIFDAGMPRPNQVRVRAPAPACIGRLTLCADFK